MVTIAMEYLHLNDGNKMPLAGLGLWKIPKDVCANTVYEAIKIGYRLLDGACDYGNEVEVGHGIKRAIDDGIVKREDLFLVSKLWNTFHRPEHVKPALQKTLKDLQVEYLDLYLIHFPISLKYVDPSVRYPPEWIHDPSGPSPRMEPDHEVTYESTWHAMEALKTEGLTRSIGCSNIGC
jgi:D-xylose reductase